MVPKIAVGGEQMWQRGWEAATFWFTARIAAFKSMSQIEKSYAAGILLSGIGVFLLVVRLPPMMAAPLFWGAGPFLFIALSRESYLVVAEHLEAAWVKWLMVPIAVMVSAYSLGSAANIVNAATGQDPGLFPRATAFMAPIAAVPAFALLVSVLAGVALLMMLFAWMMQLSSKDKIRAGRAWLWLGRLGGAFTVVVLMSPLTMAESSFGRFVEKAAGWVAQGLDMHVDQACAAGEWDRILRMNDELVLVVRRIDDDLVFRREECALRAE